MTTTRKLPDLQPLLAIRINQMIGRDAEVQHFLKACEELKDPGCLTRLFYLCGEGGIGKTRFLEEVREQTDARFHNQLNGFLCTDIIDLYDPDAHSQTELAARIAQSLDARYPDIVNPFFESFWKKIRRYRTQQANLVIDHGIREEVHNAFQASLNALAQQYPVLILLDTTESLHFDEDEVQKRAGLEAILPTSLTWITRCVEGNLCARTMFVVAGRPRPPILHERFTRLSQLTIYDHDPGLRHVELSALSAADAQLYFDALKQALEAEGFVEQARKVETITPIDREKLRALTNGSPVALALTTHFWLTEQRSRIRALIEEAPALDQRERKKRLRSILVNALGHYTFGDVTEPLHYVALLRRGMALRDLRELWKGASDDECAEIFEFLKRMSFIKNRTEQSIDPQNGDLFSETLLYMHDEIVDWIDDGFFATEPGYPRQLRRQIMLALRERNDRLEDLIHQYNQVSSVGEAQGEAQPWLEVADVYAGVYVAESAAAKAAKNIVVGDEQRAREGRRDISPEEQAQDAKYQAARRERRKVQTALMHYELRVDPKLGYSRYFELSEEAFASKQYEIDARIHADFLGWWNAERPLEGGRRNRVEALQAGLDDTWVNSDLAYRWIQRYFSQDQREGTAETLVTDRRIRETIDLHPVFAAGIASWCLLVRGNRARAQAEVDTILREFEDCITRLKTIHDETDEDSLQHIATTAVLGNAYTTRSLYTSNFDQLDQAIADCTRSASYFREIHYEADQGRALNDKSYYLALAGDPQSALIFAQDALELREKLGYGISIAFTENTIATILILADRPQSAIFRAEKALNIFRKLDNPFGEFLALRTLSEIFRRYAENIPQAIVGKRRDLESACKFAEQARNIAGGIDIGVIRLSDCVNEYASAYRDLGKFCSDNLAACESTDRPETYFKRARELFDEALEILPEGAAYDLQRVDVLINLAYLQFHLHEEDAARNTLGRAIAYVPEEYRDVKRAQHSSKRSEYWWQLSKASALRVLLARNADGADLDELLRASIEALLYSDKLTGAPRPKRRTSEILYDAFKAKTSKQLRELAQRAEQISLSMGVDTAKDKTAIRRYYEEFFGI